MKERLVSDFRYYFFDMFLVSIIGYAFYIMMGRLLSPLDYGIMMTILGLYTIASPLTSFGFNEALARFLPITGHERTKVHLVYALKRTIIFSSVIGMIVFLFSENIAYTYYSTSFMIKPLQVFSILLIFGSISIVLKGALQGTKRFFSLLLSDVFSQIFRLAVPIVLIYYGYTVISGLIGWIATFFIFDVIVIAYMFTKFSKYNPTNVDKQFFKYGISSAIFASSLWLLIQNSLLILSFINLEEAGLFSVALVFGQINLTLPLIIIGVTLPYLSEFFSKRDNDKARRLTELSLKNTFIALFPLSIFVAFFSKQIIYHIYNPTYLEASKFFLPIMLAFMFLGLNMIMMNVLYSFGKHGTRIKYTLVSCAMSILLSLYLYGTYDIIGIAYGFIIAQILTLIMLSSTCYRKMHIGFPRKILNAIPAIVIFASLMYLIDLYYINFEYGIIFIGLATLAYIVALFAFRTFDKDDFDMIKLFLGR
ncbi:MAG: oligosaccharide flippase family protein [Candidatus Aenigmarchaeota archaeon]|nr:oligosaccharide flippase family protein [Candidatus Aenigmarchaeota archaeon]